MTKICIIAGNQLEAETFASAQNLESDQWFYPTNPNDLTFKSNFHVLVVGTAGFNTPSYFFNRIYDLAQKRGKIGRV